MPRERATHPERDQRKAGRIPKISIEHEPIPKSVSRVLDAKRIRREYREKKRQPDGVSNSDEDALQHKKRRRTGMKDDEDSSALRIKPGETVPQFNSRVESSMMPLIKTALQQSSAQMRKVRREEAAQGTRKWGKQTDKGCYTLSEGLKKGLDPPAATTTDEITQPRNTAKEFQAVSTSAPRRLNDIAQEPPMINKLPRGATMYDAKPPGVLSMAQKAMMEEEREKAIRHYRELKARKLRESGGSKLDE